MTAPFIRAENLTFAYPSAKPLFEGLSLTMERGECVGLTGRSGCGKSTLAQILSGHLKPASGRVEIAGRDVTGKPQRTVFLVHQDSDLFPWQRVRDQVEFGMKSVDRARAGELLALTKLSGFENYYPFELSGGMKKRLSIARALAVGADLLIFDESFSSLDFDLRRELFSDLKDIWALTGTTILFITHDPRDLAEIARREIRL